MTCLFHARMLIPIPNSGNLGLTGTQNSGSGQNSEKSD